MAMVSETNMNGNDAEATLVVPLLEKPEGLPPGKYALIGWDMDTTGRRLIDEICQIAAFTPKESYSQYIMPYGDLNPGAQRRNNVRVVTVGRYRMLKHNKTNKILKTKSEISALTDFLDWLEKERGEASSVILVYHEPRRQTILMLLEAMNKYKLLDRFKSIVSGFADSYSLAADKCKSTVKSVSLRVLARVLLDADTMSVDSALDRAMAAYRIVEHLAQGEQQEVGAGGEAASADAVETARQWARPIATELEELGKLKVILERQNTFRPVFAPLLRLAKTQRRRVTALRRMMAEAGIVYDQVKDAWNDTKVEGLTNQLSSMSVSAKEEDIKELVEILECHFDPEKQPKVPKHRNYKQRGQDEAAGDESTSNSSQTSSPKKSNDESPSQATETAQETTN